MVAIGFSILAGSSAATGADRSYDGADRGCLIYSVGGIKFATQFSFPYSREKADTGASVHDWSGSIKPPKPGIFNTQISNPDFTGNETGIVVVRCLPPGIYKVGSYSFNGQVPGIGHFYWEGKYAPATIFHIRSGAATYIGSFMRAPSWGTTLQPVLGARGFFVVADRSTRDLPLAESKLPPGIPVSKEVIDVAGSPDPALRTSEP